MLPIEVQNVTKIYSGWYGRHPVVALDRLTLEILPGEIFGLLGPNGAGKTTLLKVLLGIVHPSAGSTSIFGISSAVPAARRRIGFLPEDIRFHTFLTGPQVLHGFGLLSGVDRSLLSGRIPRLLSSVGLSGKEHVRIRDYSKGMVQRLGIAQALVNDPELLILDEPTDGLDPIGRRDVRDLLLRLRNRGKTIFLNSHLLSEVEQTCDRTGILLNGRLARMGTVEDLTHSEGPVRIRVSQLTTHQRDRLQSVNGLAVTDDVAQNQILVSSNDPANLNAVVDRLRADGILILSMEPEQISLESRFIDVVSQYDAGHSSSPGDYSDDNRCNAPSPGPS